MSQDSQKTTPKASGKTPPDEAHKKLIIGLAILLILMFAMIAAIIIRLDSR